MAEADFQVVVSVVIVSWNAREYLLKCLETLTPAVCRHSMEIIVVDNASSDGSAESVETAFPNVRLFRNKTNLGFAKANNVGISHSSGRYLCLINSDVEVFPECINRLVDYCETHVKTGMVGPKVMGKDGAQQRSYRRFPSVWNMFCRALALDTVFHRVKLCIGYSCSNGADNAPCRVDILSGCFWLVRREALADVGLLDESFFMYGEDMDWCRRFWKHGWMLAFVPEARALHYGGASSSNAPIEFYIEMQRAELQYWRKHHSRLAAGCFFLISCLHLALRGVGYSTALLFHKAARDVYCFKMRRSVACLKWMFSGRSVPHKSL
jgi:GT2 family glycosyltransferase